MGVWIIAFVLVVLMGLILTSSIKDKEKIFLVFVAAILIFVMGSRDATDHIGSDLNNYYRLFGRAIELSWKRFIETAEVEIGYLLVNFILAKIIPWNQFILYVQAAFCVGVSLWFIYKNTKNIYLATIFFVSFGTFQFYLTGFRQAIAMSICLFAYEAAKNKKLLKFIIFVLLAISMHQTAIVFVPMYFIVNLKNKPRNTALLIAGMYCLYFFIPQLIDFGNEVFDKEYKADYVGNILGGLVPIIIYILTILVTLFIKKDKEKFDKAEMAPLFKTTLLGAGIYCMRYSALVLERISFYFNPAMPVLLAENIRSVEGTKKRTMLQFLAILLSGALFVWRVSSQIKEYNFFWW